MTRINLGIDPSELHNKHLLAEHREIKRIPNAITSGKANLEGIPDKFSLGKGHVKFFYDKIGYLYDRYLSLYDECIARGFNVSNYADAFLGVPSELFGSYHPTDDDANIVRERIAERLKVMNAK